MLRVVTYMGLFLFIMSAACVDRLDLDVGDVKEYAIVVEGYISDEPGPYEVRVSTTYDVDSTVVKKTVPPVKRIVMSDNFGNSEVLTGDTGLYRTSVGGIQGVIGRAYTLRIELADGRIYETIPDTMRPPGEIEKIDHEIVSFKDAVGKPFHGFDIYFDANAGESKEQLFMWKIEMTYRVSTQPWDNLKLCGPGNAKCLDPLDCSGYIVILNQLVYLKPCTCCDCWVTLDPEAPLVSDYETMQKGAVARVKAGRLPITWESMNYGTHVTIEQYSLSPQAYNFWKLVRAQTDALNSLFQPVNGKVTGNWTQVSGDEGPIMGLFYASAINRKSVHLGFANLPDTTIVPPGKLQPVDCETLPGTVDVPPKNWRAQ